MPLYEYKCHKCGKTFEIIQKFVDEPLKVHEECGGEVERLISTSALQFKGTGWYVTDYAKKGNSPASNGKHESKNEGSKGEGSRGEGSKGEGSKSEGSKSESKSESSSGSSESKPSSSSSGSSSSDSK